jgi:hypothetical protein
VPAKKPVPMPNDVLITLEEDYINTDKKSSISQLMKDLYHINITWANPLIRIGTFVLCRYFVSSYLAPTVISLIST